jgi:hypothetical protein
MFSVDAGLLFVQDLRVIVTAVSVNIFLPFLTELPLIPVLKHFEHLQFD